MARELQRFNNRGETAAPRGWHADAMSSHLPCAIYEDCGACTLMPREADEQVASKRRSVEQLLGAPVDAFHASPRPLSYRARVEFKTDEAGRLGYYRPRSHDHVPAASCVIARPEIRETALTLPPLPGIPVVELRSDGEGVVLHAKTHAMRRGPKSGRRKGNRSSGPSPAKGLRRREAATLLRGAVPEGACGLRGVALDGRRLSGDVQLKLQAGGVAHRISPGSFYQVNLEVNELLVRRVRSELLSRPTTGVLDLYAGSGNLSFPLAAAGKKVTQIEVAGSSVDDARRTAERENLEASFVCGNAGRYEAGQHFFDAAILDPPRAGAPGVLGQLLLTRPRVIAYVSCDPKSLARDLRALTGSGYRIARVELFDMFPQTAHVETLCILEPAD